MNCLCMFLAGPLFYSPFAAPASAESDYRCPDEASQTGESSLSLAASGEACPNGADRPNAPQQGFRVRLGGNRCGAWKGATGDTARYLAFLRKCFSCPEEQISIRDRSVTLETKFYVDPLQLLKIFRWA